MAISGVNPKCYILALFVRDDGARFLLGDDPFEFKDNQLHFQQNTIANDVVEVQGNDGYLLAGQVRRPGTQMFDGYVCNGTNSKEEVEAKRRSFLQFFRRSHFYKVIYVFPNGTAIQRKQGFLVDDPTVQELYQQYPEYHVALNFEDVNYYTYEEDNQGQEIYAKEAIVPLAGGGATGGLIWDEYGVVWEDPWSLPLSISGVQFQILNNAGARASIDNVKLYGDTFQQTYSGANLFNYTDVQSASASGVTVDDEGWITLTKDNSSGGSTSYINYFSNPMQLAPNTNYAIIIEVKNKQTSLGTGSEYLSLTTGNVLDQWTASLNYPLNTLQANSVYVAVQRTKSDLSSASIGLRMFLATPAGASNSITFRASVLADTSITPETFVYQPYTGGIPAPNPDYPQPIQVVTGEQTVTISDGVSSQSYPISLTGKNLFNVNATPTYTNGVSVSGNLTVTATSSGTNKYALYRLVEAKNYVGSKVCVSCSSMHPSSTNDARIEIGLCNADGTSKTSKAYTNNVNIKPSFTVTDDPSKPYIYVALYASYNSSASIGNYVGYGKVMVNRGSTPGAYASYSPIELCKLSSVSGAPSILSYQDYIYKSGSDWYIHKETEKAVYDGSVDEEWGLHNTYNSIVGFRWVGAGAGHSNSAILSEKLLPIYITTYNSNNRTYGKIATLESSSTSVNSTVFITAPNSSITTLAQFTSWLSNNNVTVYYASATPTDTKITDATLIGQLNTLGTMKLFIGENNVLVSTPIPNLPATLAFNYYTKFAAIGAEWEEGGTKGATIVNVDAIDNTYPVWQLTGPATNPTLSVLTTNTALTYNGTITASQTLVIDMFNKTATLNGTSVIGNISGDFVYMAPGTNRVAYTAGNTDAPDSTIYWQEVVG